MGYRWQLLKKLFSLRWHVGAGDNLSPCRLIRQSLPYYFSFSGRARLPMTIYVNINSRCNLKCRMCDIGQKNCESAFFKNLIGDDGQDFPASRFKKLIDEVAKFKPYICITTTEPLLYPDLFEIIRYTVDKGLKINITTNGLLLEQNAEKLVQAGLNRLSLSIDGPPQIHDEIRGCPGLHGRVMSGLRKMVDIRKKRGLLHPQVYFNTAIIDKNHQDIVRTIESVPLDLIDHWNFKLMVFCTQEMADRHNAIYGKKYLATETCLAGGVLLESIDPSLLHDQVQMAKNMYGNKCSFYFDDSANALHRYFFKADQFMDATKCVMPWFVAQLTARGDVIGLTRCYYSSFGNIMNKPFEEVWNGRDMRGFRKDLKRLGRFPACARCDGVLFR